MLTRTLTLTLAFAAVAAASGFTMEKTGGPPADGLPAGLAELLAAEGVAVKDSSGKTVAEYWGREAPFEGEPVSGFGIRYDSIPEGALIALVRFHERGSDFRAQGIPAGVYTLRYSLHPEDGNHMGVAASRDFAVLNPAAKDLEPAKNLSFDELMELTKTVGNPHPTVARIELSQSSDQAPNLWQNDYEHWVLDIASGGDVVGVVVYGHGDE
jgi:hypothetical protein